MIAELLRVPAQSKEVEAWFTGKRFAAMLALFILAMFPDVILGGNTFIFRDFGKFGYPLAYHYRESFWRGEIPLWNPLNNCGTPFLAQWNTLVLYPGSLFYLLLPLQWSLTAFSLLHLFLCGLTMYALARNWTGNRIAATVAGLGFAFNGFTLNCLIWPNYIASLAWMPLVVLTVERAWRRGGRHVVLAALVGGIQMLSGTPEIILFTWLLLALLWLLQLLERNAARQQVAGRFLLTILLVTGLAAAQLFPFLDLMNCSQRVSGFSQDEWAMPMTGWANFLVPLFRTFRSSPGVHFQDDQNITSSYYLGISIIALALIAAWRVRGRRVRLFSAITAICLVLALGHEAKLYSALLTIFPPVGLMRFPIKFVILPVFLAPLLAAFAVRDYLDGPPEDRRHFWRAGLKVSIVAVLAIALILTFDFYFPGKDEVWWVTASNGLTRAAFLVAILGLWFSVGRSPDARWTWAIVLTLLTLTWLDTVTHAPRQNPSAERAVFLPSYSPLSGLKPRPSLGESRAMLSLEGILAHRTKLLTNSATGYLLNRLVLYDNLNLLDDLPKVDGFYALEIREERDVRFSLYPTTNTYRAPLADFLSVSQVTSATNLFTWTARSSYLPMATVGQEPTFLDPRATLIALTSSQFNPRSSVFLRPEDRTQVSVTNQAQAQIVTSNWTAQRVTLEVQASEPALVVIGQSFHHNWRAFVDGQQTRLLRANYAFQALQVPAGRHQVVLVYRDRLFYCGAAVSLATLLCLILLVRNAKKVRLIVPIAETAKVEAPTQG